MNESRTALLLRTSAVLWWIWGLFHLFIGVALLVFLRGEHPVGQLAVIPGLLDLSFMGTPLRFAPVATLEQYSANLAWIGAVVTVGGVYVWRGSKNAIFFCALIAGLSDLAYFMFIDLAGYADPPGPQMTYICATAIALSLFAYFKGVAPSKTSLTGTPT